MNDYTTLGHDDNFIEELENNIWVMDNHKWALYAWETFRHRSGIKTFTLLHADFHWDAVYDFFEQPEQDAALLAADLSQIYAIIKNEEGVQFDSFICPAVRRGLFDEVHFFCMENDGSDIGIHDNILASTRTEQFFHADVNSMATYPFKSPLVFDLCLDLFNRSDMFCTGDLWSDEEIVQFLVSLQGLLRKAAVVTLSLSFDYSGAVDDTRHLAALVLPTILQWRATAEV